MAVAAVEDDALRERSSCRSFCVSEGSRWRDLRNSGLVRMLRVDGRSFARARISEVEIDVTEVGTGQFVSSSA